MYHRATVVFGRTDRQFWRSTVAQLVLLAEVHWPPAGAAAEEPVERGNFGDLMMLHAMQR